MQKILNFIDGKLIEPITGRYIDNYNPATGKVYSLIPDSGEKDVALAVNAAAKAFPNWSSRSNDQRHDIMVKLADLIETNLDRLAQAESIDNGKPLSLAKQVDIPRASKNFRFFATAILHYASQSHEMTNQAINYTLRHPLGVVGCISPWNLPLYLFSWKIAPAIAAGNCVVAKPSEITPMTAFLLSELCNEAGLPNGVLNIVHGYGHKTGEAIVRSEQVKAISFTGGTVTGAKIAAITAPLFKKASLELGGKNPNIIFADCNYDDMLETTVRSSFANQGQICLCGSRIYVEKSIYERFKVDFIAKTKALNIGDPLDERTNVGAVVSKPHMEKILGYIKLAREEGGTILCGGEQVILDGRCKDGYFVQPTIIEGLAPDCRTNREEIFGPVVTITPFAKEEDALMMANSTQYGLSATIWTRDLSRAHRLATQVQSGVIWINTWMMRDLRTPFGGMKNSGMGREGGFEALNFFTQMKNVCIKYN
ncbi:MAG: aldehyde dehydrogenase [bacterium]|nr:aldehyde dehydrogenase [bacterium]